MFRYENHTFFLVPTSLSKQDTEFNIFNDAGEMIGTTIQGIAHGRFSPDIKEKIEDYLIEESLKLEAQLKFQREFNIPIHESSQLELSPTQIMDIMDSKWSIPVDVIDGMLYS